MTWLRLNCYLKHLESSLIIDLGKEIHWSSLNLDLKSGTALSESHLSLSVEIQKSFGDDPSDFSWSCSTMSGQVLRVDMNVLIDAKQFSIRHVILWAWRVLVGV